MQRKMYPKRRCLLLITLLVFSFFHSPAAFGTERSLSFGRFGTVSLYYHAPRPSHVVLFVSGDGGWNLGVIERILP